MTNIAVENKQFHGKIHYEWSFSIAMLNYQRVACETCESIPQIGVSEVILRDLVFQVLVILQGKSMVIQIRQEKCEELAARDTTTTTSTTTTTTTTSTQAETGRCGNPE